LVKKLEFQYNDLVKYSGRDLPKLRIRTMAELPVLIAKIFETRNF